MIVGWRGIFPARYGCTITADTTTYEKIDDVAYSINVTNLENIFVNMYAGQTNEPVTGIVQLIKQ